MRSTRTEPTANKRWITLGAEAVLIVFSVLLALALDEWRQGLADQRLVGRVQTTIHDELTRNRRIVQGRLAYHQKMLKAVQSFLDQNIEVQGERPVLKRQPQMEDLEITNGLGAAGSLEKTGRELALNSGALEQMDFSMMVALSQTYAKQQEVEEQEKLLLAALSLLYRGYFKEGSLGGEVVDFMAALTDFVLREQELLAEYDRALPLTGK